MGVIVAEEELEKEDFAEKSKDDQERDGHVVVLGERSPIDGCPPDPSGSALGHILPWPVARVEVEPEVVLHISLEEEPKPGGGFAGPGPGPGDEEEWQVEEEKDGRDAPGVVAR